LYFVCIYLYRSLFRLYLKQLNKKWKIKNRRATLKFFKIHLCHSKENHLYLFYFRLYLKGYYLDQKVPGIHSENSKYKFYSLKVILFPSKYSPSTATHLCQRLIQLSKHFWNSIVGIAVFDFSITSFRLLNAFPVMVFWLDRTEKNRRELYQVNSMAVGWYSFRSWSKIHG